MIRRLKNILLFWGIDPRVFIYNIIYGPGYIRDYIRFRRVSKPGGYGLKFGKIYPALRDKRQPGGALSDHYFYQDLLVAQMIYQNKPARHIDIGSRIDGFVAHVASFREIEVFDIRPTSYRIPNVKFVTVDFMNPDPNLTDYTDSVSCLHALEHFGLGRYGDQIDPDGHIKGLGAISRVLKKKGKLYLSVPIGPSRVEFNAHRVFSVRYILQLVQDSFQLDSFSYIDDRKVLHAFVQLTETGIDSSFGCRFGCGIFEMTRR